MVGSTQVSGAIVYRADKLIQQSDGIHRAPRAGNSSTFSCRPGLPARVVLPIACAATVAESGSGGTITERTGAGAASGASARERAAGAPWRGNS